MRPKRYRCRYCEGIVTTTERAEWYDAKASCTKLKGHSDVVTLVSAQDEQGNPIVRAVLKGPKKKPRVDFLKTIPRWLQAPIKEVCTDRYEGFINAVEEVLPQATIVADRFHVAKLYRAAVDELRKTELKALKGPSRKKHTPD